MRILRKWLVATGLVMLSQVCAAQITYDGCRDARGAPVASMVNMGLRDVAMASLGPGGAPVIQYNPQVLAWLAPQTRLFFYAHECAHHFRGHIFGTVHPLAAEQDADCTGIRALIDSGDLDESDIRVIQNDLARVAQGDWTHLPGPQRAINLRACLGSAQQQQRPMRASSPQSRIATACVTNFGPCPMMNAVPVGSSCVCNTGAGPIWGLAR